jgi:hypothetical protein
VQCHVEYGDEFLAAVAVDVVPYPCWPLLVVVAPVVVVGVYMVLVV